ncbi:MAG: glutathione S-transferase family protein [Sandaracinaceae bacterium]|nr:glutathione S-transferase family protein [Sandaracinaceae bacterium]
MRLYHHPFSSNARRAVITAHHLAQLAGAPKVELALVDLSKGQQRTPEYLHMNPNGRVPVLDDDGFFLSESHAIQIYLAEKTPGQTLYPSEARAKADVNRWMFWNAHHFAPAVAVLNWERVVKPMLGRGETDPKEIARGEMLLGDCFRVLDQHLADHQYLSGDGLTLADLAVSTPLMAIGPAKLPIEGRTHILRWFDAMRELPAWKATS